MANTEADKVVCRICFSLKVETNYLFEKKYRGNSLADILKEYTSIQVHNDFSVSSRVCFKCTEVILDFNSLMIFFKTREASTKLDELKCEYAEHDSFINECIGDESSEYKITEADNSNLELEIGDENLSDADIKEGVSSEEDENENLESVDTDCVKYACGECGDCFLFKSGFQRHMTIKHGKYLQEDDCELFSSKIIAKIPVFFPNQVERFTKEEIKVTVKVSNCDHQCKICLDTFSNHVQLMKHREVHKSFICEICGASFIKKNYLQEHKLIHQEKRYKCNKCDKFFSHRSSLRRHKYTHGTFRGFVCDTCGQGFKHKPNLDVHIQAKHLKEKNFHCSECDLSFTVKSWLDKHFMRKHTTRKKDFICSECGTSYLEKGTLKRHMAEKHSGREQIRHNCPVCEKSYTEKRRLRRHLENKHSYPLKNEGSTVAEKIENSEFTEKN